MTFRYIDCKQCRSRITLQVYAGNTTVSRAAEDIKCPTCGKESTYSGDDFGDSKGPSSSI
jgi:DNA-directed RNA polymerase subunit RPC12/RpoP